MAEIGLYADVSALDDVRRMMYELGEFYTEEQEMALDRIGADIVNTLQHEIRHRPQGGRLEPPNFQGNLANSLVWGTETLSSGNVGLAIGIRGVATEYGNPADYWLAFERGGKVPGLRRALIEMQEFGEGGASSAAADRLIHWAFNKSEWDGDGDTPMKILNSIAYDNNEQTGGSFLFEKYFKIDDGGNVTGLQSPTIDTVYYWLNQLLDNISRFTRRGRTYSVWRGKGGAFSGQQSPIADPLGSSLEFRGLLRRDEIYGDLKADLDVAAGGDVFEALDYDVTGFRRGIFGDPLARADAEQATRNMTITEELKLMG